MNDSTITSIAMKSLLKFSNDGIFFFSDDGTILDCSKACEQIFNLSTNRILDKNIFHLFSNSNKSIDLSSLVLGLKRDDQSYFTGHCNNSNKNSIQARVCHLESNESIIYGFFITHIKGYKSHLIPSFNFSETDESVMDILDTNMFGASIATLEGELIYGNKSLLELFKCTKKDFINRFATDFYANKEQREKIVLELKEKGFIKSIDIELKRLDGSTFWASLSFLKTQFAGKDCYFCWFYDLTKRLEMENDLNYQRRLAIHSAKLASIGELAAGIGHEINNPLAITTGYIDKIEKKIKQFDLYNNLKSDFDIIRTSNKRIKTITRDLRTFSRSEKDSIENFNIFETVNEVLSLINEIYSVHGITFSKDIPKNDVCIIKGNKGRIHQVLLNLFSNARDTLSDQEFKKITISSEIDNDTVHLLISDNGLGIHTNIISKIFDPFFTTKAVNKGTGIGLSLSHKFIQDQNGSLTVDSEVGIGSTFKISLPIVSLSVNEVPKELCESSPLRSETMTTDNTYLQ